MATDLHRKSPERRVYFRDLNVDDENVKMDLTETMWCAVDKSGSGQAPMAEFCEHVSESLNSIKEGFFFSDLLRNNQILKISSL